jgi:DNA-binding transcriptional regulator GbsR (MarR family)
LTASEAASILQNDKFIVILQCKDMGASKTELFTKEQNDIAAMAKVLAHPARIAIIHQLMATNQCICGDLVKELGLAQPTISQHLRELKLIGLIQGSVEGAAVCYCINPEVWQKFRLAFGTLFNFQPIQQQCC